jgi:hypothetical protein
MLAPIPWSFRRRDNQVPLDSRKSGSRSQANRAAGQEG